MFLQTMMWFLIRCHNEYAFDVAYTQQKNLHKPCIKFLSQLFGHKCIWRVYNHFEIPNWRLLACPKFLGCFSFMRSKPNSIKDMSNRMHCLCPEIEIKSSRMQHILDTFYDSHVASFFFVVLLRLVKSTCLKFDFSLSQMLLKCITYVLPTIVTSKFHHGNSCDS